MQAYNGCNDAVIHELKAQSETYNVKAQKLMNTHFLERLTPQEAFSDKKLMAVRSFLKKVPDWAQGEGIESLKTQWLAAKLGITRHAFLENEGFQEFAEEQKLYNYLASYGDVLQEDSAHKITIRSSGVWQLWKPIQAPRADYRNHKLPWVYGPEGLQQGKDMYNFTTFEPFKKEDPARWGYRYLFEFCSCSNGSITDGAHSWLRLYTPEGYIYSVGLNRGGKENWFSHVKLPFRVFKGKLMSPDVSEFWPCAIRTIAVEIFKEGFEKIKAKVEKDKADDQLTIQVVGDNCLMYCKDCALLADVELDTEEDAVTLLLSPRVKKLVAPLPAPVKKIGCFVSYPLMNAIQLFLGSWYIDKKVRAQRGVTPKIAMPYEFLLPSRTKVHHPFTLFDRVHREVNEWRAKQSGEESRYKLPPVKRRSNHAVEDSVALLFASMIFLRIYSRKLKA